ncbi:MAG: AraC family transcriptional regulator [Pseudomonadota bacterium]
MDAIFIMPDPLSLIIVSLNIGQALLCASLLAVRARRTAVYWPLAAFFAANAMTEAETIVAAIAPQHSALFTAITLTFLLTLSPSLWLYVSGLVSQTPWRLTRAHARHYIAAIFGALTIPMAVIIAPEARVEIFGHGDSNIDTSTTLAVAFYVIALLLFWIGQSGYYLTRSLRTLIRYNRRLKDLFASTEQRELTWLVYLSVLAGMIWATVVFSFFVNMFAETERPEPIWLDVLSLALTWTLALWGLRQAPGFEGAFDSLTETEKAPGSAAAEQPKQKYERSALRAEQATRIAAKIHDAMQRDTLYLDPALSLGKLSEHLGISPNMISQTLNETIGESFFDYVNRWRIEAATPKVLLADETILEIALSVGFNSRSAFYNAFKKQKGETPSAFRRAHASRKNAGG